MSDTFRFIDERVEGSITFNGSIENPSDRLDPLSFIEWVKYNKENITDTATYIARYNSYLQNWFQERNITRQQSEATVQQLYIGLINEIVINYSSLDEKRFLKNIDTGNSRDLATVVPFFSKKIKDICLYFSTLREQAQQTIVQNNLNGSNFGVETLLYNAIIKSLEADDVVEFIDTLNLNISAIRDNITFDVEDLYDANPHVWDISPTQIAETTGNSKDLRNEYFSLNQYDIDPYLFFNINQSILNAILKYPFYLIELGQKLNITPIIKSDQLNLLKDSDYTQLINTEDSQELSLLNQAQLIKKYMGVDFYYVVTDSTGRFTLSALLFEAENKFANPINKRYPTVEAVPSVEYLQTAKEVGLFFKPDKLGALNFTSFKFTAFLKDNLTPNTLYFFPDPKLFGNISGLTKKDYQTPFNFFEDNTVAIQSFANQYAFGEVTTEPWLQTFRAYQTREASLGLANFGLSRYVDSQGFFDGPRKTIWSNKDTFPLIPANKFPIDKRFETLLTIPKTLVQYKTDVFGNEYGLYKDVEPLKTTKLIQKNTGTALYACVALDGHLFYDPISGYNFNYSLEDEDKNYSGITLRTSSSTLCSLSADGEFTLLGTPTLIASYQFIPEIFCADYLETEYSCEIKDGTTFIASVSGLLPDVSSDIPGYNPDSSSLYYDELVDGGVNNLTPPTYRANFAYPGDFDYMPPLSAIKDFDGNLFLVANSAQPCGANEENVQLYTEPSFFLNFHIPERETEVDTVLSSINVRNTLYETRNTEYGQLYYRNSNNSLISPISAALSAVFIKYTPEQKHEIYHKLLNFDLFYDTIVFYTENYVFFETLKYNNTLDLPNKGSSGLVYLTKNTSPFFEKVSNIWFNESEKILFICKTTLLPQNSATNYKIVYPKIYTYNLTQETFVQIFPTDKDSALTFTSLEQFSLITKNIELEIVEIDEPILTYSATTQRYRLSYIGRDTSNYPHMFVVEFSFVTGILKVLSTTVYEPAINVLHQNFANKRVNQCFNTNTILGNKVGFIDEGDNTFVWGGTTLVPPDEIIPPDIEEQTPLASFNGEILITEDGNSIIYSS